MKSSRFVPASKRLGASYFKRGAYSASADCIMDNFNCCVTLWLLGCADLTYGRLKREGFPKAEDCALLILSQA
jgi:hypothetical protein